MASLREEERCDPAVVGGMVRTLQAILSEGSPSSGLSTLPSSVAHDMSMEPPLVEETPQEKSEPESAPPTPVELPSTGSSVIGEDEPVPDLPSRPSVNDKMPQNNIQADHNEAWAKLGGIAMKNLFRTFSNSNSTARSADSAGAHRSSQISTSTVEVKEIQVEEEDEWVAVQD